jgi:hypothetical protein
MIGLGLLSLDLTSRIYIQRQMVGFGLVWLGFLALSKWQSVSRYPIESFFSSIPNLDVRAVTGIH